MKHYLERHAHAETDRVVQDYLDYLPTDSYEDGCVFQGRKGCTLPRDMRSITCNTFLCPSLRNIQDHLEKDAVRTVFAVAMALAPPIDVGPHQPRIGGDALLPIVLYLNRNNRLGRNARDDERE